LSPLFIYIKNPNEQEFGKQQQIHTQLLVQHRFLGKNQKDLFFDSTITISYRRSSSSCLANQEKLSQSSRSRSASFGEDLSARLQILTAGTCYRSYSPAIIDSPSRSTRPSLNANIRYPIVSNSSST
jgi:hypothetical protein